jgi:hypothetical protein
MKCLTCLTSGDQLYQAGSIHVPQNAKTVLRLVSIMQNLGLVIYDLIGTGFIKSLGIWTNGQKYYCCHLGF